MERLVDVFINRAGDIERGPFEPQTVIVQSFGMGQWLKIRQAEQLGIAANLDCILPANLIWRLYQALLPEQDLPDESPFSIERLTWHLMKRFPDCEGDEFAPVQQFLNGPGDAQVRAYQLGEKIGTLFDQYLIYRPAWMNGWDEGDEPPVSWQRTLWQILSTEPGLDARAHRARLHAALLSRLDEREPLPAEVPRHLSVIGLSTLPPIHLEALQALSAHIDIDLYFLNPCQHYWGDIVSEKEQAKRSIKSLLGKESLSDEDYLEIGNPLLSSWGKQGREFLELLLDTPGIEEAEFFDSPDGESMLDIVRRDILELTFGGEFGTDQVPQKQPVSADDLSVQIHICHSKMREVEVLYDQLTRLFDQNPTLRPAEVIVMMPDVAAYAPFVEAVFPRNKMPYTIADRAIGEESPILVALTTLLSLPELRMTSTDVMDLLEVPTIARCFGLLDSDLQLITRWIQTAGIRWEIDEHTRAERWQVPENRANTWRFGLDRLLLGFAMNKDDTLFKGILPENVESNEAELLGTLCHVIDLLANYRTALSSPKSASEWRDTVLRLIDDFFDPILDEELELAAVRDLLIRLENETTVTGFEQPISPRLFRYWLDQQLSVTQQSRGFISGGITFATLVPMRSIPFRVVCLLGMNDGEYPREDRPPTFDLMAREGYRRGDRSKRGDDRYLFLEALISARDTFYISYEGRSIRDNKERPPSVLVSEFTSYLRSLFDTEIATEHPLQPFSDSYFDESHPNLVTYSEDWYHALTQPEAVGPFVPQALAERDTLLLENTDQLKRFLRHPARAFMQDRLGIYLGEDDMELDDAEPFTLDSLEQFGLSDEILEATLSGRSLDDVRAASRASGLVMTGDIGGRQFDKSLSRAMQIADAIRAIATGALTKVSGECKLPSGDVITGTLSGLAGNTLIEYRPSRLSVRRLLVAWVDHLFANVVRGDTETQLLAIESDKLKVAHFAPLAAEEAARHLEDLALLYRDSLKKPLPLVPETSQKYLESIDDGKSPDEASELALAVWDNDNNDFCESQDSYFSRLFEFPERFDDEFLHVARRVLGPLRAALEA